MRRHFLQDLRLFFSQKKEDTNHVGLDEMRLMTTRIFYFSVLFVSSC